MGKGVFLRAQKKVLGKVSSKESVKKFIDDPDVEALLEEIHAFAEKETGSEKEADQLMKCIIKIVVKLMILIKNKELKEAEFADLLKFKKKFNTVILTLLSFHEVAHTFDKAVISKHFAEAEAILEGVIKPHLTEKSVNRLKKAFNYYGNGDILSKLYNDDNFKESRNTICSALNKMMETGKI
eukprot:Colp12_sorted_trinity150504_noHs@24268